MMPRIAAIIFALALCGTQGSLAAERPNIILVLADDLGYGDLGCYGQERIRTPNIDQMAKEGLRFTDFCAGSTVCAPSRCVLMTGYHTGHALIRGNARDPLRPEDVTVAELLKGAGYRTALCGKWGLGEAGSTGVPTKKGFDYFFGYLNQQHAHNYYPTFLWRNEERVPLKNVVPNEGPSGDGKATTRVEYSHDLVAAEALQFLDQQSTDHPFFLYLALTTPHANNEAKQEGMEVPDLGPYADLDWPAPAKGHAAMITRMDADLGRVFAKLKEKKFDDNTLVIFTSDNGPHAEGGNKPDFNDSNGPLKGIKRALTEGGIRVPFIARWPGKIPAGKTTNFIGGFQDMLPTFAELADGKGVPADCDGLSIVPTLSGKESEQKQHDYLYWAFYERGAGHALRQGNWKLVQQPYYSPPRLYNLAEDLGEEHDLAREQPDRVRELLKKMAAANQPNAAWKFPEKPGIR
jgi:arylsulfatase A-like enzyme